MDRMATAINSVVEASFPHIFLFDLMMGKCCPSVWRFLHWSRTGAVISLVCGRRFQMAVIIIHSLLLFFFFFFLFFLFCFLSRFVSCLFD